MSESEYIPKAQSWAGTVSDTLTSAKNDIDSYTSGAMSTQELVSAFYRVIKKNN